MEETDLELGFRFQPTEEELLDVYLKKMIMGKNSRIEIIGYLNVYLYEPWDLPARAKMGEREWYFYVPRDRKHGSGGRPNRTTQSGFWKATGSDRKIFSLSYPKRHQGLKKTLVFYKGRAPTGSKTRWVMNEYRLPDSCPLPKEIVLCKIYHRKATSMKVLDQRAMDVEIKTLEQTAMELGIKISPISSHQEVIEQQFGKNIIEGAENLNDFLSSKVVTGEEIGSESCVKEIIYSSKANECIVEDIVISQQTNEISKRKHKTSPISLHREVIEKQFGRTQLEAARNLNVSLSTLKRKCKDVGIDEWQGPQSGKSKVRDSQGDQIGMNGDDIRASQGPSVVNHDSILDGVVLDIKVQYGDDLVNFCLPFSTTVLKSVEEEIFQSFHLDRGTYKLKYYDESKDLISIIRDEHFWNCVISSRLLTDPTIRLHVVPIA